MVVNCIPWGLTVLHGGSDGVNCIPWGLTVLHGGSDGVNCIPWGLTVLHGGSYGVNCIPVSRWCIQVGGATTVLRISSPVTALRLQQRTVTR